MLLSAWALALGLMFLSGAGIASADPTVPTFDHIITIVMENRSYAELIGNTAQAPYLNQLASQYGIAANFHAVAHPSLPNYLALTAGTTFGIATDCTTCFVNAPNIVADRVSPSGRTWKAYMESMPSTCFVGDAYPYQQKHNPFAYYDNIRFTAQCSNIVPFTNFASDFSAIATTPAYVWITPNMCNDTHDCPVSTGDAWLQSNVPTILNSPAYTSQNTLLVITWDEDYGALTNRVLTMVIGKTVPAGYQSPVNYDHYSLLKTIEQSWGLASLTANDGAAIPMSDFFPASPPVCTVNCPPPVGATPELGSLLLFGAGGAGLVLQRLARRRWLRRGN